MGRHRTWLPPLAIAAVALGLLHAGLYPYDFGRGNQVAWSETGSGLSFARGIAFSDGPLYWKASERPRELTVEAWVVPSADRRGVRTALALADGERVPPFEIATGRGAIALRYRVGSWLGQNSRAVVLERPLSGRPLLHLALTSGERGTRLYVDGDAPDVLRLRQPLLPGGAAFSGRLVLGSSPDGSGAWSGEFRALAVFDRALDAEQVREHAERVEQRGVRSLLAERQLRALYAFDAGGGSQVRNLAQSESPIQIPRGFHALRWGVLELPESRSWTGPALRDVLVNLLGFVPFGLLVAYAIRTWLGRSLRSALAGACAASVAVSLTIELGQALLPMRHSSALDLLLNVGGGALGAAIAAALCLWWLPAAAPPGVSRWAEGERTESDSAPPPRAERDSAPPV